MGCLAQTCGLAGEECMQGTKCISSIRRSWLTWDDSAWRTEGSGGILSMWLNRYLKGECKEDGTRFFPVVHSDNGYKIKDNKFIWIQEKKNYCESGQTVGQVAQSYCGVSILGESESPTKGSSGKPAYGWVEDWTTGNSEKPFCHHMNMKVSRHQPNMKVRRESRDFAIHYLIVAYNQNASWYKKSQRYAEFYRIGRRIKTL